jgi:hypothetical protein
MSATGSNGPGNVRRRKNNNTSRTRRTPETSRKTESSHVKFKQTVARPPQETRVTTPRYAEMTHAINQLRNQGIPEAKIPDLAWMRFCATHQVTEMHARTLATAVTTKKMLFTVAHGIRQMPSTISTGLQKAKDTSTQLRARVVNRQGSAKPRFQNKIPHKAYQPFTSQSQPFKQGAQWMEKMDVVGENFEIIVGRTSYIRDQVDFETAGSAFDAIHLLLTGFKEARAINRIISNLVTGRLNQPKGSAEKWAVLHRIKMNEIRIAQINLHKIIIELEAKPQPLSAKDTKALQAAFRLMSKLEDRAIIVQREFSHKGSFLGSEELFLLDLDGMTSTELDTLARDLNQQNLELNKHLPALEKWIAVRKEETEIASQVRALGYVDTIITTLRLPNQVAHFLKENAHIGIDAIEHITPTLRSFNYIALGLTAPLKLISTGFSIYQWIDSEHVIAKINEYLANRTTLAAEGKAAPLDDEMQAIAQQIQTNQDRWVKLLNSIISTIGTGTFFINLGLIVFPTAIASIAALATTISAGVVITGIAPWVIFIAGITLTASTAGLLLYRIARYAQNQYRLRKCEYVVTQFDRLFGPESMSTTDAERRKIEAELSQLLAYDLTTLSQTEKEVLHHKFRLKLIHLSPEYAIDRFLNRLIEEMQSDKPREAFEFIKSLGIFTETELSAIKKSAKKGIAYKEIKDLLQKRLGE